MRHGFLMTALLISLILWGCSSASAGADTETSSSETVKETVQPEIREVSEGSSDRIPFEVLFDKASLEGGNEEEATVVIAAETEDWDYTVSAENGTISNVKENSFVYTVPEREDEREDTIKVRFSDNENGALYEYTIPLFFPNVVLE